MASNARPPGATGRRKHRPPSECTALDQAQLLLLSESFARAGSQGAVQPSEGLLSLIEIGMSLGSERDPVRLLKALSRTARNILGARQAILKIGEEDVAESLHVITSGVDEADAERIQSADLRSRTLGLVRSGKSLRGESRDGNPAAAGLPDAFPQAFAWLAAPIRAYARSCGWICFIDKIGAKRFNEADENLAATLSSQIGRIYERNCMSEGPFIRSRDAIPSAPGPMGTEGELRASEELFRSAFDHTNVAFVLTDLDNRFLRVNASFAKLFGYTQAELLGMTMADVTHPDDLAESYSKRAELMRGDAHFFQIEKRYLHRSGRTIWGLTNVSLMRGRRGEPLLYIGQVQDITERKVAQDALASSERRFRALADSIPQIVWTASPDGGIDYVNSRGMEYSDLGSDGLLGWGWERAIHPEDVSGVREQWSDVLRSGAPRDIELRLRRADGQYRWHMARQVPIRDERQAVVRWFGTCTDIEDQKRSEAELRQKTELLRAVADGTTDAVFVKDRQGRYLLFNPAAERFVGRSADEVLGRDDTILFDPVGARVVMERDRRIMELGSVETAEEVLTAAGVTRIYQATKAAYRDQQGNVVGLIGVSRDVTDRKRTEAALRESEERYRSLAELSADGIFVNKGGRIIYANPALQRMLRANSKDDLLGKTPFDIIHPDYHEMVRERIQTVVEKRESVPFVEEQYVALDGTTVDVEIAATPFEEHGELTVLVTSRDLTERKRADEALRENEARYRHLFEANPHPMWVYDVETLRFLAVNDAAVSRYGYSRDEFLRMTIRDIRPAVDVPVLLTELQEPETKLQPGKEWRHRWKDGTIRQVEVASHAFKYGDRPARLVLATDVTERKRAEAALKREREFIRLVLDTDPNVIFVKDADGQFVLANKSLADLYGTTPEELVGRMPGENLPSPEELSEYRRVEQEVLRTGRSARVDETNTRPDGQRRWFHTIKVPLALPDGTTHLLGIACDITERKEAEAALREREELLRSIISHIPCAVFWKDRNSTYLGCNEQVARDHDMKGADEVVGATDFELGVAPAEAEFYRECDRQVMTTGEPLLNVEETQTRRDGSIASLLTSKVPLRDQHGAVVGVLGVYQDITDRKKIELQLQHSQKMEAIGSLAGGVAHDFNNLLTVINGHSELLLSSIDARDPLRESVGEIRTAGDRAAGLTRQLLAFGRKSVLAPAAIDLNDLIASLSRLLVRLIGEDVDLQVRAAANLCKAKVDPGQFEQVVMNLALNARDAMPHGGKLTIETGNVDLVDASASVFPGSKSGRFVRVSVSDTGHGMDEQTKLRAFEPFFTTKGPQHGTGLGLAVVHGIVSQSGGWVDVYSEPEHGTTFKVYLPRADVEDAEVESERPSPPKGGTESILLVEDEEGVRSLARKVLQRQGYAVTEACNGEDALRKVRDAKCPMDLVVTDMVMPVMGGLQLSERLMEDRPDVQVLFMSGYTDDVVVRHGILGPDAPFLQKPFTPDALARKVREVLNQRRPN